MNLSTIRAAGRLHVRGGRVLTVAREHSVDTATLGIEDREDRHIAMNSQQRQQVLRPTRTFKGKWVTAHEGDIAMEIVAVATGKIIGHAYYSGDAIGLHSYGSVPDWYGPASGWQVAIEPRPDLTAEAMIKAILRCKYAPVQLVAFETETETRETAFEIAQMLSDIYCYEPIGVGTIVEDGTIVGVTNPGPDDPRSDLPRTSHVLGSILWNRKRSGMCLHFQPPAQASDWAVSSFHNQLAHTSTELDQVDVFKDDLRVGQLPGAS